MTDSDTVKDWKRNTSSDDVAAVSDFLGYPTLISDG